MSTQHDEWQADLEASRLAEREAIRRRNLTWRWARVSALALIVIAVPLGFSALAFGYIAAATNSNGWGMASGVSLAGMAISLIIGGIVLVGEDCR